MVEIAGQLIADRASIRAYVTENARVLEDAQALGRLARAKIDLKDAAAEHFAVEADDRAALRGMVEEEIEALCADLRLATVTVQAQVERRVRNWAQGATIALAVFVGGIIVLLALGVQDGVVGFGLPLIAAVIALFAFS